MASHMLFRSPSGEVVRVKQGFSWETFFIGSTRAMVRRTWPLLLTLVVGAFAIYWTRGTLPGGSSRNLALLLALLALYLLYMVFCGVHGNRWLVASLLRRGFRRVDPDKP